MIKSINLPRQDFSLSKSLLSVCKKPAAGSDSNPEIDFLLLEKDMEQLQMIQSKTCQQIVEFVDEHHEEFIKINTRFQCMEASIEGSERVLKNLIPKIDHYKSQHYDKESKIQQSVAAYEKSMLQQQLISKSKEQAQFLVDFVQDFQNFINLNFEELSEKSKFLIVRLLRRNKLIKSIFEHPFVQSAATDHFSIINLLDNVVEELEFYLSEQLSRISSAKQIRNMEFDGFTLLDELKIWYQYMGKEQTFYETIEDTIVGRQLSSLEKEMICHKQGDQAKLEGLVSQFFQCLFDMVQEFPHDYPQKRILSIIYKFLTKKELSFLYAPVGSTFPTFYSLYKSSVSSISKEEVRRQLENHHGWNLKFWADLRIKSIMDRSGKDKENNLNKWIQIVFKKNFMLKGVKSYMIKLAFQLVNRFTQKIEMQPQFSHLFLNNLIEQVNLVPKTAHAKLMEAFEDEMKIDDGITKRINEIEQQMCRILGDAIEKWVQTNIQMIIQSCKSSLQNCKGFVMKVAGSNKKEKIKVCINKKESFLKPVHGFFHNNPELSEKSKQFIVGLVMRKTLQYYDSAYAKQIYNICQTNQLTAEKTKNVMEILSLERRELFGEIEKEDDV